jgi:hypothetical protein
MAKVGAQRAAELTGRSKSTIQRAMNAGKLSYEVDNNGRRVIDVAELDRAFGLMPQDAGPRGGSVAIEAELEKATAMLEAERLKMRIRMLEDQLDSANDQIDDLKGQRDQWQKQAQQVLITSQYSQKQAEELKEELKERDRRAELRRQQIEQQRRGASSSANAARPRPQGGGTGRPRVEGQSRPAATEDRKVGPIEQQRIAAAAAVRNFDIQSLWKKVRGQNEDGTVETATDNNGNERAAS